jgi:hypothetical protein
MTRSKRNPDAQSIDWSRDDYVLRDVTPGRIAIFENTSGQITIQQGTNNAVHVSSHDLGWLIQQLYSLACQLGYEAPQPPQPPQPPMLPPLRLIPRNRNRDGRDTACNRRAPSRS